MAPTSHTKRSVVLASIGICSAVAATYIGREFVVSVRGIWTDGELGAGQREVDIAPTLWALAGSLLLVLALTLTFSIVGLALARRIWRRFPWLSHGFRSRLSNGPWPLLLVSLGVIALSVAMLFLRIGITVPIAPPEYPWRLDTGLYFFRLAIAPVVVAVLASRSRMQPPATFGIVLAVGVVASATSASRAVAVAYSLCVLAIVFHRRWLAFPAFIVTIALTVNVASRARTLLIPRIWTDPALQAIYVSETSTAVALDASPSQSIGANLVDFAGARALGLDEFGLALTFNYSDVSLQGALFALGETLGLRNMTSPTCPELRELFANGAERVGGLNLDPFGRLYAGSCGSTNAYLVALVLTAVLFSLFILGGVGLKLRWGMERATTILCLLGFLLWFDSRYTVIRFGLVTLAAALLLDRRISKPPDDWRESSASAVCER